MDGWRGGCVKRRTVYQSSWTVGLEVDGGESGDGRWALALRQRRGVEVGVEMEMEMEGLRELELELELVLCGQERPQGFKLSKTDKVVGPGNGSR